jgi:putative peptidoglycan lipid II flippase
MAQEERRMKQTIAATLFFIAGTAIGKLLGFAKEVSLGAYFGVTYEVDAYVVVLNVPVVIFAGISGAFAFSFIPVFLNLHRTDPQAAQRFMNNFINMTLLFLIIPLTLAEVFAREAIGLIAPEFAEQTAALAAVMLRMILPIVVTLFISDLFNAYLNSFHRFGVTSLHWVIFNGFSLVIFFLLVAKLGIHAMVIGTVIASLFQMVLPLIAARRGGYRYQWTLKFKDPALKQMFWISIPAFISSIAVQINLLVDRNLASGLAEGSIAAMNFAQKLYFIPLGLIAAPLLTVVYPMFVEAAQSQQWSRLRGMVQQNMKLLIFMFLPVFFCMVLFAVPIVSFVYEYGNFNERAVTMTAVALQFYALGALMQPLKDLMDRTLFSMKRNKAIMLASIISMIINVTLNLLLIQSMGMAGLALATSIASLGNVIALFLFIRVQLRQRDGEIESNPEASRLKDQQARGGYLPDLPFMIKCLLASALTVLAMSAVFLYIGNEEKWSVATTFGIGIIIYLAGAYFLRIHELRALIAFIRRKTDSQGRP